MNTLLLEKMESIELFHLVRINENNNQKDAKLKIFKLRKFKMYFVFIY